MQNPSYSVLTLVLELIFRNFCVLVFESMTNLFDPWEIPIQEWVSVVFTQRPNSNLNSVFTIQATGRYFQHGSNFCVSHPFDFDDPSFIGRVYSRHLQSWNTVHFQQHLEILHPCKIYSLYQFVKAFQFAVHIAAIESLICWVIILQRNLCLDFTEDNWLFHHHIRLHWSIVKGFMFCTFPRLLPKDWDDLQKQLCEK